MKSTEKINRNQFMMTSLDDMITPESNVREIPFGDVHKMAPFQKRGIAPNGCMIFSWTHHFEVFINDVSNFF